MANVRITYTEEEDARITAAVRTVETQLPQRRRGAANTPAGRGRAGVEVITAQITGHTGAAHAWEEIDADGNAVTDGRSGTATDNPALNLGGATLADDTQVLLVQSTYLDGSDTKPAMVIFQPGQTLPVPTAVGQGLFCTSFTDSTHYTTAFTFPLMHA
jgi:hypothetical protein